MPRPKDTGLGSSGYASEFYTANPKYTRATKGVVRPNAETFKKQMGIDVNAKENRNIAPQSMREAAMQRKTESIEEKVAKSGVKSLTANEKMHYEARVKKGAPLKEVSPGYSEFVRDKAMKDKAIEMVKKSESKASASKPSASSKSAPAKKK